MYDLKPAPKPQKQFLRALAIVAIIISLPFVCFALLVAGAFLKGFFWL